MGYVLRQSFSVRHSMVLQVVISIYISELIKFYMRINKALILLFHRLIKPITVVARSKA
jgi:hypothetical protein